MPKTKLRFLFLAKMGKPAGKELRNRKKQCETMIFIVSWDIKTWDIK